MNKVINNSPETTEGSVIDFAFAGENIKKRLTGIDLESRLKVEVKTRTSSEQNFLIFK